MGDRDALDYELYGLQVRMEAYLSQIIVQLQGLSGKCGGNMQLRTPSELLDAAERKATSDQMLGRALAGKHGSADAMDGAARKLVPAELMRVRERRASPSDVPTPASLQQIQSRMDVRALPRPADASTAPSAAIVGVPLSHACPSRAWCSSHGPTGVTESPASSS